ncbi:hypothetical protein PCASD_17764 [Puccinia coronata f. sp. avenae]|uniref:Myb/SANT-like domain-containing protein n=1 Tax=Puccinia coronata f. sp. avenae TaxID=200324 RepID=A0A2N5TYT1_9BASI|nr:hypothetical protein PCASD_17764 [Puccinia coronata f. sp. avenae]
MSQQSTNQSHHPPGRRGRSGRGRPRGSRTAPPIYHTGNRAATLRLLEQRALEQQASQETSEQQDDEDIDPEDQTFVVPTASQRGTRKKLLWTGPMEMMMLDLYVAEVEKGKRSDNGFQSTSHRHVAQELWKHFPETEYLLNANKVKSKLNQSFKRDYNTFVACKDASGFGWDKTSCEVTAADDVWERYVAVHASARKFWGVPFPEFRQLDKIFGTSLATGEAAQSLSQQLLLPSQTTNPKTPGEGNVVLGDQPGQKTPSPTNYLTRSHSGPRKESAASAINGLVDYLKTKHEYMIQQTQQRESSSVNTSSGLTIVQKAVALYYEAHMEDTSQNEALDLFEVLQDESNAQMFTSIRDKQLRHVKLKLKCD